MMPAESEKQKKSACIAIGVKEGKVEAKAGSASAKMAKSMTKAQLRDYCPANPKSKDVERFRKAQTR